MNPSRADLNLVKMDPNGKMIVHENQGRNKPAIMMTTGVIVESFLKRIDSGVSANGGTYQV